MTLVYLILAQLAGLFVHYVNEWKKGKTDCSFKDYIIGEWPATLSSVITATMTSMGGYLALDGDLVGKALMGAIYAAFLTGYAADSLLNKAPDKKYDKTNINDMLRDDRAL